MRNIIALLSLLLSPLAYAQTVTIFVETAGFQNSSGAISNDMAWGLVIDTTGTGFSNLSNSQLEPFTFPSFSQSVDMGDGLIFFRAESNTSNSGPAGGFTDGYMNRVSSIPVNDNPAANGISSGHLYGLIWFPVASALESDSYGFIDLGLAIPPQGGNPNISTEVNPTSADFTVVPEPSTYAAILGFLALAFVGARRMRK